MMALDENSESPTFLQLLQPTCGPVVTHIPHFDLAYIPHEMTVMTQPEGGRRYTAITEPDEGYTWTR